MDQSPCDKAFLLLPSSYPGAIFTPDSPIPSPTLSPGCLCSHHPILSPGEKFNLCIFIVVAHTNPTPHESFISRSLSLSSSLSLSPSSHMHPRLDLAPQVRNDDEKMRGNQQRFAMLSCTRSCSGVNENSPHRRRLELPSYLCYIAQSKGCSWSDLRPFLLHWYKDLLGKSL